MQSGASDRGSAIWSLAGAARRLSAQDSTILAIGLFGPLASERDSPDGDARVLIVLKKDRQPGGFRNSPHYELAFEGASVCVEPFVVTAEELPRIARLRPMIRNALSKVIHLSGDPGVWDEMRKRVATEATPANHREHAPEYGSE